MNTELLLSQYLTEYAEKEVCAIERTRSAVKYLIKHLGHLDHMRLTDGVLKRYRKADTLAPASTNRELAVLSAALHYALEERRIRTAPEVPKRKGAAVRVKWLRPEKIEHILSVSNPFAGLHKFIRLALLTAQRKEAILSVRWDQIDESRNVMWFNDHGLTHEDRRKGRGTVPIVSGLKPLLETLRNPSPYVLVNERGTRYRDINWDHWKTVVTAIGEPELVPHDLRHTAATNLIRMGVPLFDVSKLLGHANTRITERIYVTYEPEFLSNAVSHMGGLCGA